jgi:hypothetical protein
MLFKPYVIIATTTVAPWVNLTLASGTAIIAGFGTPAARLIPGGMVEVRGLVQSASATQGVIIATLPAGHFPPANVRKAVQLATSGGGSQVGIVNIGFTGNITVEYAASAGNVLAVSLDFTFSYI